MKKQTIPNLFIYTALECEAKPLIKYFDLKKENKHPFSIYKGPSTILTVSGVGKIAMAGAVAYTQALFQSIPSPVLVNLGIAGHSSLPIETLVLATKIIDKDSGKRFYPQLIGNDWPKTSSIQTSSIPCTEYNAHYLNDMEASAFYETAIKFSSNELIHSIKVISDNAQSTIESINSKLVIQWLTNHLSQINSLLSHWLSLQQSMRANDLKEFDAIVQRWHFTVGGQLKLKSLLLRWQALSSAPWLDTFESNPNNSKEVLKKLESDLNNLDVYL